MPDVYLVGTGNHTTDTAAISAAVARVSTLGGSTRLYGDFSSDLITFPAPTRDVTLELEGTITMTASATWTLPPKFHMTGVGQAVGTSRYYTACGKIVGPNAANTPAIFFTNSNGPNYLKRLAVSSNSANAAAISVLGGSGIIFEDIGIDLNANGCEGIRLDTAFWIEMNRIGIVASSNQGHCIHLTCGPGSGGYVGLIRMRFMQLWSKGILVDIQPDAPPSPAASIIIEKVELENPQTSLLTVNCANSGYMGPITLTDCSLADNADPTIPLVTVTHDPAQGSVLTALEINRYSTGSAYLLAADRNIPGLKINSPIGTENLDGQAVNIGVKQKQFIHESFGRSDSIWDGAGASMGPSVVPYASLAVNQIPSGWTVSNGTLTQGKTGPDGSATAGRVICTSGGFANVQFYSQGPATVSVGDWFIYGVWQRAIANTSNVFFNTLRMSLASGGNPSPLFNSLANVSNALPLATSTFGSSWKSLTFADQVTAFSDGTSTSGSVSVVMDLLVRPLNSADVWMPWAIHIPASAGWSEMDAIRLARYLTNIVAGAPAGALAIYPHQPLYLGNDTNLYRGAAGILKTDGIMAAVGGLGVGNSAAATTPGSVVKKVQIFDASGASLGYIPIYSSIA